MSWRRFAGFALVLAAACGARSGLRLPEEGASASDTGIDDPGDVGAARRCPPVSSSWSTEVIAGDSPTSYAIAADPRCGLFAVWGDAASRLMLSSIDEHGAWVHEPTSMVGHVVAAAATNGAVHVAFRNEDGIFYGARTGGGAWGKPELIDPAGLDFGAMRVDGAGVVHLVYEGVVGIGDELRYAVRRGATWTIDGVDKRDPFRPTLGLAPDGTVYFGYEYLNNSEDHGCTLARKSGGVFTHVDLPRLDGHTSSSDCTVRVGRDGVLHLAYGGYGAAGHALRHAYGTFDSLRFEEVALIASFGSDVNAAELDSADALHVAYRPSDASTTPPLNAAVLRAGAEPAIETVPSGKGSAGTLVAVDGADVVHLVYYLDGRLEHASRR